MLDNNFEKIHYPYFHKEEPIEEIIKGTYADKDANIEMVEYIIEKAIDVNKTNRRSRFTPLMAAASYGRAEIAKLLLEHGADKNIVEEKGFNATDFARKMNKKSVLELLEFDENNPKNTAYAR